MAALSARHALAVVAVVCSVQLGQAEMYCGDLNCYTILGVERGEDPATYKKAYRTLSLQWHPDKNPDNKEEATLKFQQIATAYEVVSKDDLRDAYNYYLDHPEQAMYNTMRYYRAAYQPQTPLWVVFSALGILVSLAQMMAWWEGARSFEKGPIFKQMLEEEYVKNCKRGRQGYQTGELTDAKRKTVREEFKRRLAEEEPQCPLHYGWSITLIPCVFYHWPIAAGKWLTWRFSPSVRAELQAENERVAEAQRKEEEDERQEEEEEERRAAEKDEKKEKNKAFLAEKLKLEEEKKRKWAEEAAREAEEEEEEGGRTVTGKVASVDELRKKGNFLVEVAYDDDRQRVQLVVDRPLAVGQQATVALEGATLPNGKVATRSKIAGEWSEGVLVEAGPAPAGAASAKGDAEEDVPETPAATVEAEDKPRRRKK